MKKQIMKKFNNDDLLKEICEIYDYEIIHKEGSKLTLANGDNKYDYDNTILALVDFLDTLVESEELYRLEGSEITWIPEIDYIKELEAKLLFNENSNSINDTLLYGEVPEKIYKNISVYLDKQIKRTDNLLKMYSERKTQKKIMRAFLTTEFIIEDGDIKYTKVAKKESLERVLLHGDTSELEIDEFDIYTKEGIIEEMPLLESSKIKKFAIDIPVVVTLDRNSFEVQMNVNPIYLF